MRNYDADPVAQMRETYDSTSKFERVDFVAKMLQSEPDAMSEALPKPVFPQRAVIIEFPKAKQEQKQTKKFTLPPDYTGAYGGDWYVNGKNTGPLKDRGKKSNAGDYMRDKDGRMRFVQRGKR